LPDPGLGGKKTHDPPQEGPGRARRLRRPREGLDRSLSRDPVGLEVILPAQMLIIYWAGNHTCDPSAVM
jgi:hypothetical protein